MATPERPQDPGEHGYGGSQQEKDEDGAQEHPLENPEADPRQDGEDDQEGRREDEQSASDANTTSPEQRAEAFLGLLRPGAAG
jgi:hypothetical protein